MTASHRNEASGSKHNEQSRRTKPSVVLRCSEKEVRRNNGVGEGKSAGEGGKGGKREKRLCQANGKRSSTNVTGENLPSFPIDF